MGSLIQCQTLLLYQGLGLAVAPEGLQAEFMRNFTVYYLYCFLNNANNLLYLRRKSKFQVSFSIQFITPDNINHDIPVPGNWIKSGMLVEYEVIGKICSKYSSTDAYQNATTSNITCIWYEITNTCIDSNDEDTHNLKVNDCRVKVSIC
ncbi:unnamed protein product [Schistosoma guineensis]|nr:unnamed protein product [Schistosoma guineensis]